MARRRPPVEVPKIDSFLCQKCGRDLFTCKGHNNDIEIIGREALFTRGEWWWEIASNNDMVLALLKQEAVAKLLHEAGFFDDTVSLHGGLGVDGLALIDNDFGAGPPKIVGFESRSPRSGTKRARRELSAR